MHSASESNQFIWKTSSGMWAFVLVIAALLGITFYAGIREMIHSWDVREEYSHGYMIPFITAFLIWQRKNILDRTEFSGSWAGVMLVLFGFVLFVLGTLSTITTIVQYAFLVVIIGTALSITGRDGIRPILVPLLFLVFMIPLPGFFLNNLSSQLQLISSELGVAVIRAFGISVFLEGNVIDLRLHIQGRVLETDHHFPVQHPPYGSDEQFPDRCDWSFGGILGPSACGGLPA